jgi:hypothetical protein
LVVNMPVFGRRKGAPCLLLTAIISAGTGNHDGEWEVIWIGDGRGCKEPQRLVTASLSEAAEQATASALALYAAGDLAPDADLQFAIYPWDYGKSAPIFEVSGGPDSFTACNSFDDSAPTVSAGTLEELVAEVGGQPDGAEAMLRWGRPFSNLPTGAPGY